VKKFKGPSKKGRMLRYLPEILGLVLLTLVFLLLPGCDDRPGEWSMIIYPDRTDRTRFVVTPRFKTFSYCRESALERMKELQIEKTGDYECGFRCELSGDPHRMNVCQEIHR
jgi:hypothetical protein